MHPHDRGITARRAPPVDHVRSSLPFSPASGLRSPQEERKCVGGAAGGQRGGWSNCWSSSPWDPSIRPRQQATLRPCAAADCIYGSAAVAAEKPKSCIPAVDRSVGIVWGTHAIEQRVRRHDEYYAQHLSAPQRAQITVRNHERVAESMQESRARPAQSTPCSAIRRNNCEYGGKSDKEPSALGRTGFSSPAKRSYLSGQMGSDLPAMACALVSGAALPIRRLAPAR